MGVAVLEEWRPVRGFENCYEVNRKGEVRSRKTGHCRILKPRLNSKTGYSFVNLYNGGASETKTLHRIVAEAFIPNPDGLQYVNHINEDKTDNRVENLEWCNQQYNVNYSKAKRFKPVALYTVDGEKIATFVSEKAAAEVLGVGKSCVFQALSGLQHTCAGFVVEYETEVD